MQVAVRPRLTAGVALVGASLVVASTVTPVPDIHLPDMHLPAIRTADIDLAAAVNPLAIYAQVLQGALANASTLAQNAQPGVLLKQVLANALNDVTTVGGGVATALTTQVPQLVQTAVTQLAAGNVAGAADALLQIPVAVGLPALPALLNPLQSVANVIKAFTADPLATELLLSGFIAPLISTPAAAATAIQNVIGAVGTGNPMAVVGALLGAPATVADGLLNGGYGPDLGPLTGNPFPVKAGGLLSSPTLVFPPDGNFFLNTGGPIAALEQVLQKIAAALAPQPAAVKAAQPDVASVPATAATSVTLTTGSTAASTPAKEATAVSGGSTQTPASKPAESVTSAATTSATESASTTKDSTPKPESTDAKPTDKGSDVTTGNKVEPKPSSDSEATKPGDESTSTTTHESTTEKAGATSVATSGAAEKHARHAK